MTNTWLAALEDENGIWLDDPIGYDTKPAAVEWALVRWPKRKLEPSHVIVIYRCVIDEVIEPEEGQG
jgi:hypothetical protein